MRQRSSALRSEMFGNKIPIKSGSKYLPQVEEKELSEREEGVGFALRWKRKGDHPPFVRDLRASRFRRFAG